MLCVSWCKEYERTGEFCDKTIGSIGGVVFVDVRSLDDVAGDFWPLRFLEAPRWLQQVEARGLNEGLAFVIIEHGASIVPNERETQPDYLP